LLSVEQFCDSSSCSFCFLVLKSKLSRRCSFV
jgi:hypothetical protein